MLRGKVSASRNGTSANGRSVREGCEVDRFVRSIVTGRRKPRSTQLNKYEKSAAKLFLDAFKSDAPVQVVPEVVRLPRAAERVQLVTFLRRRSHLGGVVPVEELLADNAASRRSRNVEDFGEGEDRVERDVVRRCGLLDGGRKLRISLEPLRKLSAVFAVHRAA